jgi:hypothetical protein
VSTLDVTDLHALTRDLGNAAQHIERDVTAVVSRGALNIKRDAVRLISGHPRSKHYPLTIGYDITTDSDGILAEIGPDKDRRQGGLGNILEYGTSKNAPLPHLGPALLAEEPRFAAAMETVASDALR